jgi:cellulose synthase operon protein YhjQ
LAAQQAAQLAAQQAAEQAAQQAAQEAAWQAEIAAQQAAQQAAQLAAQQAAQEAAQQRAWQQSRPDRFSVGPAQSPTPAPAAAPYYPPQPQQFDYPGYAPQQAYQPAPSQPQYAPVREESTMQSRFPWAPPDPRENGGRPAWLTQERGDIASQPPSQAPLPQAPEDTLQGSRDRMTSRWFALRSVFEGVQAPVEAVPAPVPSRAPSLAVFSLAGGVGKTSLVATLGRALSARGERVLLVDTAAFGLLPFFFGARDQRPGLLRTFSPPGVSGDAPIQMVAIDPEALGPDMAGQEALTAEISKYSRGASRVIVDLATASGATTRRVMRMDPMVLVPVIPDMNSVVSVSSIEAFFQHNGSAAVKPALPYYVLNQFDPSLPLHLDVREVLREQLGDRLLPFTLRRAPAVSEALAEGMTVMDYAPNSTVAEDFGSLAGWVKSLSAPASSSYRGVRWSER